MRGSVTLLQYEHGIIRQVTDVLAEMVKKDSFSKHQKQTAKIADFLYSYVSKYHHIKEERFLFRTAAAMSSELATGAEELKGDHKKVNALIARLRQLSKRKEAYENGTLAHVAKDLVDRMTVHIRHEEDVFYPKVEDALSMEQDAELMAAYEEFSMSKFDASFVRQSEDFAIKVQDEVLGPGYYKGIQ